MKTLTRDYGTAPCSGRGGVAWPAPQNFLRDVTSHSCVSFGRGGRGKKKKGPSLQTFAAPAVEAGKGREMAFGIRTRTKSGIIAHTRGHFFLFLVEALA